MTTKPQIPRTQVESSNLASVGYDMKMKLLQVEFKNGSIYNYSNVPEQTAVEMLQPPKEYEGSIGVYFAENVKSAFEFEKIKDVNPKPPKKAKAAKEAEAAAE